MLREMTEIYKQHKGHGSTLVMILETKLSPEFLQSIDKSICRSFMQSSR